MTSERTIWIGTAFLVVLLGALIGVGASGVGVVILAVLGTVLFAGLGWWMRRPADANWLPRWVMLGFLAKIGGTVARYYVLVVLYDSGGDAVRYHRAAESITGLWSQGIDPLIFEGTGGFGTKVTELVTAGLYSVFTPDLLGGFMMFAIIAFMGQLLVYAAYRRWAPPHTLKPYAILIFLLPTYAFWPSSVGKDALILLGMGASAYMAARALQAYELKWLLGLGVSVLAVGVIRIHVATLFVASLVVTTLVSRSRSDASKAVNFRRLVVSGTLAGAIVLGIGLFPDTLGVDLSSTEAADDFAADVLRRTTKGGTVLSGDPVSSPTDIPGALALALFRPYAFEATELQHYFAALETTAILLLTIWLAPSAIRNWRAWRTNAYVVFCTAYTFAFSIAFSVVRNAGIVARQRGQVLAFFLAVILILGWRERAIKRRPRVALRDPEPTLVGATSTPPR